MSDLSSNSDAQGGDPSQRTAGSSSRRPDGSPQRIGEYEVVRVLGEGGYGRVYLAKDPPLKREVAIKQPLTQFLTPDLRAQFIKEAQATARIHHPNVCAIHAIGTDADDVPYLVMPYIPGGTLAGVLKARTHPLAVRDAVCIVHRISLGVAEAHMHGVIHRDLKPGNVLGNPEKGEWFVTDFGLALLIDEMQRRDTKTGEVKGTPAYMSPEQWRGKSADIGPPADVYSLGVILYELVTGSRPLDVMMMHGKYLPPSEVYPGLDAQIDAICAKALEQTASKRYPSASEFADALTVLIDGSSDGLTQKPPADGRGSSDPATEPTGASAERPADVIRIERISVTDPSPRPAQVYHAEFPPLPQDILDLEGRVADLTATVEQVRGGTHPQLRPACEVRARLKAELTAAKARLTEAEAALPRGAAGLFTKAFKGDSPPSLAALRQRIDVDMPTEAFVAVVTRHQEMRTARHNLEQADDEFKEQCQAELTRLRADLAAAKKNLDQLQRADFETVVRIWLSGVTCDEFPITDWPRVERALLARRYCEFAQNGPQCLAEAERVFDTCCSERNEVVDWERVCRNPRSVKACKNYLTRNPKGPHAKEVAERLESFAWAEVIDGKTEEHYRAYLRIYPGEAHASEVAELLSRLLRSRLLTDLTNTDLRREYKEVRSPGCEHRDNQREWWSIIGTAGLITLASAVAATLIWMTETGLPSLVIVTGIAIVSFIKLTDIINNTLLFVVPFSVSVVLYCIIVIKHNYFPWSVINHLYAVAVELCNAAVIWFAYHRIASGPRLSHVGPLPCRDYLLISTSKANARYLKSKGKPGA